MIKALSPLNILILGKLRQFSGNTSTANRIRQYFEENGYYCVGKDIDQFKEKNKLIEFLHNEEFQVIIGIHAHHAGSILNGVPLPYGLIFGGTDLNENTKDPEKMEVMTECVENAKFLVAFSNPMESKAFKIWPSQSKEKLTKIPQAVKTYKKPSMTVKVLKEHYGLDEDAIFFTLVAGIRPAKDPMQLLTVFTRVSTTPARHPLVNIHEKYNIGEDSIIFTLVAGIRPVKDPLHLVTVFTDWHQLTNRKVFLVIIGPKVDRDYFELFAEIIDGCPGIIYIGSQTIFDTHAIVKESFALINSSISEGMALSILEAMDLGVPVIARNIPGNSALIEDSVTGILYTGPEDFIERAEELLHNDKLRKSLIHNAKTKLEKEHGLAMEKAAYIKLVNGLKEYYNPQWYEELKKAEEEAAAALEEEERAAAEEAERREAAAQDEAKQAKSKNTKSRRKSSKWGKIDPEELAKLKEVAAAKDNDKSLRTEKQSGSETKDSKGKDTKRTAPSKVDKNAEDSRKTSPRNGSKLDSNGQTTGKSVSQAKKSPLASKKKVAKSPEVDSGSGSGSGKSSSSSKGKAAQGDFDVKPSDGAMKRKPITIPKAD